MLENAVSEIAILLTNKTGLTVSAISGTDHQILSTEQAKHHQFPPARPTPSADRGAARTPRRRVRSFQAAGASAGG
jgi:hypothetical protein